jgi:Predicted pyrophosphatase
MELNKYQQLAMRTRFNDKPLSLEFLYASIGLAGETAEVLECFESGFITNYHELREELGDVTWYISYFCTLMNMDMSSLQSVDIEPSHYHLLKGLPIYVGNLCDQEKKVYFHKHKRDCCNSRIWLAYILDNVRIMCKTYNMDFDLILHENIEKLKRRYPDGFSEEHSQKRKGY